MRTLDFGWDCRFAALNVDPQLGASLSTHSQASMPGGLPGSMPSGLQAYLPGSGLPQVPATGMGPAAMGGPPMLQPVDSMGGLTGRMSDASVGFLPGLQCLKSAAALVVTKQIEIH